MKKRREQNRKKLFLVFFLIFLSPWILATEISGTIEEVYFDWYQEGYKEGFMAGNKDGFIEGYEV